MKSKPFILTLATTLAAWITGSSLLAGDSVHYEILTVPAESPGPPWYADFSREFIPTDGEHVSIVFWRDPDGVPADFNLLDFIDPPHAWSATPLFEGEEYWTEESPPPVRGRYWNNGAMPVYLVDLEELEDAIEDDVLTIGELEAFASLRIGYATHVRYDVRIRRGPGEGNDRARYTAIGELEDGGRFFVRLFEEVDPETGLSAVDAVIRFPGSR